MPRRLPFPPGHPARRAHDKLLEARRYGLQAYDLMQKVDLDSDQREKLREEVQGVRLALDEIASYLAASPERGAER